ncbi:M20 metallopeptidase family protein [Clostridium transplantifaecale]|uniref:M20 metallopeptidase family protein n=1 Tax=Clostridium transplantifaecale TaxID=2479838 RepID=UPI000F639CA8|nr:M20 family metallopeptidase [Clostridium transplantifaecale]
MLNHKAQQLQEKIICWRRELHKIPELGLNLPCTQDYLCRVLDSMGAPYRLYTESSGIETVIRGGEEGKTIALRCDMDALPIREQTGVSYASDNGCMHACGHDMHMAMMLGAIMLLQGHKDRIKGQVKCLFQPGEEGGQGARKMVEEGAMEHPEVDAVLGLHVTNTIPELGPGDIGLKKGILMAGSDAFSIRMLGKGGHISDVDHVANPIPAAARAVLKIQSLSASCRELSEPSVIAVGKICGGDKGNAIPDEVTLYGSVRTRSRKTRALLLRRLKEDAKWAAEREGCRCELTYTDSNCVVSNDPDLTDSLITTARSLFAEGYTEITSNIMASEDIGQFFQGRVGAYIHLGCGFSDGREIFPLHNAHFFPNESVLWKGSAMLAQGAIDWLRGQ